MTFLAFTGLSNCLFSSALAALVWRKCPRRDWATAYGITNATIAIFSLFYVMWQCAPTAEAALFPMKALTGSAMWINQALLVFVCIFLDKLPTHRRTLWIIAGLNLFFSYLNWSGGLYPNLEPRFGFGFWPNITSWFPVYIIFWHAELVFAFSLLWQGLRSANGTKKSQLKYFLWAFAIGYIGGISNWFLWFNIDLPPYLNILISVYVSMVGYAMLKHRLMNIDIVVRKTLIYSLVTAALTALYLGLGIISVHTFEMAIGHRGVWFTLGIALLTTVVFHPLRQVIQTFIDKKFSRERVDREEKLAHFSTNIARQNNDLAVGNSLLQLLEETFHPQFLGLYILKDKSYVSQVPTTNKELPGSIYLNEPWLALLSGDPIVLSATLTDPKTTFLNSLKVQVVTPLHLGKELFGFVLLGQKRSETSYSTEDTTLLRIISAQAALALERPRLLNEFSAVFMHEIKTPLTRISLPAELTFMAMEDFEHSRNLPPETVDKIKKRMKYIMEQTGLAAKRLDAVKGLLSADEAQLTRLDIRRILQGSIDAAADIIGKATVDVSLPGRIMLIGNARQMDIVFTNLIKNSIEAMASQPRKEITIEGYLRDENIEIHFSDSGPGIEDENHEKVFDPFFTTKAEGGRGMGLYLCSQIMKVHGGSIRVGRLAGGGSEFYFDVTGGKE